MTANLRDRGGELPERGNEMAFYEIVCRGKKPRILAADTLEDAKKMRDQVFSTGKYERVYIRQYMRGKCGADRYRILRSLMKMK